MSTIAVSVSALLLLLAGCSATPPPTADRAENPASPAATESPRAPFVPPQAAASSAAPHEHHAPAPEVTPMEAEQHEADPQTVIYTCPMHPEVRSAEPGTCPQCGMALIPVEKEPGSP